MRETSVRLTSRTIFSAIEKLLITHGDHRRCADGRKTPSGDGIGFFLKNANPVPVAVAAWNHDHVSMHENSNEIEPLAPLTYTVADVAALAGVSRKKVYHWVKLGRLKSLPMRHFRFHKAHVHRFLGGGL